MKILLVCLSSMTDRLKDSIKIAICLSGRRYVFHPNLNSVYVIDAFTDYQRRFKPDPNPYVAQKSWKPCLCNNDPAGFKGNTNDVGPVGRRSFVPTTKRVQIDDKLDRTFRDEDKSKK